MRRVEIEKGFEYHINTLIRIDEFFSSPGLADVNFSTAMLIAGSSYRNGAVILLVLLESLKWAYHSSDQIRILCLLDHHLEKTTLYGLSLDNLSVCQAPSLRGCLGEVMNLATTTALRGSRPSHCKCERASRGREKDRTTPTPNPCVDRAVPFKVLH